MREPAMMRLQASAFGKDYSGMDYEELPGRIS